MRANFFSGMGQLVMIEIRTTRITDESDIPYIREWFNDPGVLRWFPMLTPFEIDDSMRYWAYFASINGGLTAVLEDKPVGAALLNLNSGQKTKHQCLISIIVDASVRGRGIGGQLLVALEERARSLRLTMLHLEVYEGNPAIHLYERAGYKVYGKQEKFIKEDGKFFGKILMQKEII